MEEEEGKNNVRLYKSGAEKRKKRALMKKEEKKMKMTLDKFIVRTENVDSAPVQIDENTAVVDLDIAALTNSDRNVSENSLDGLKNNEDNQCSSVYVNVNDPGLWLKKDFELYREYFCFNSPNRNEHLIHTSARQISGKERTLNANHFFRKKRNDECVSRDWLIYSPSKNSLFCFICKLYSASEQSLCNTGYTDWKNVSQRLSEHENSSVHRDAVCKYSSRKDADSHVDCNLVQERENEIKYWKNVLRRVVEVIKFLSQRGLAFFGSDETIGSVSNGNFLGSIELISLFDPFMAEHLEKYANAGKGKVSYLSSTIVDEFINIMGQKVMKKIVQDISGAKYFGIILDSTPDVSHVDQLSIVVRYADEKGKPVEHFIKVIPLNNHSSSNLCDVVLNELESLSLDIKNCRGQSYDNASNMAGRYSGLQARLKSVNPLAEYVPCSAHSLNLVGTVAVECNNQVVSFFGFVQSLYNFFSMSTHRWQVLESNLKEDKQSLTLKNLSGTRWSARADATKALRKGYIKIKTALKEIEENGNEKVATRHEASCLLKQLEKLETAILTVVWDSLLQRINKVSGTLQGPSCNLSILVPLFESLEIFVLSVRNNFDQYETEAFNLVEDEVTYVVKRKKKVPKSRMLDDTTSESVELEERDRFIFDVHYVLCDSLMTQLTKRKEAYAELELKFGFLYKELNEQNKEKICEDAKQFQQVHANDIDDDFVDEYIQFRTFLHSVNDPEEQLRKLKELKMEHTFPNVDSCLRILLSMPISNSSSERSFSSLKRIKNCLRSNLKQ